MVTTTLRVLLLIVAIAGAVALVINFNAFLAIVYGCAVVGAALATFVTRRRLDAAVLSGTITLASFSATVVSIAAFNISFNEDESALLLFVIIVVAPAVVIPGFLAGWLIADLRDLIESRQRPPEWPQRLPHV